VELGQRSVAEHLVYFAFEVGDAVVGAEKLAEVFDVVEKAIGEDVRRALFVQAAQVSDTAPGRE